MTKLYDLARNRNVHFALRNIQTGGEAMTLEEVQRKVLGVTVECPDRGEEVGWKDGVYTEFGYRPFLDHPHAACNGTGRVPRFPEPGKPCNVRIRGDFGAGDPNFPEARGERHPENCPRCHGLGYVPSDDSWVLLACAFEWRFQSLKGATAAYCRLKPNSLDYGRHGSTHKEAAWHALLEACLNENS